MTPSHDLDNLLWEEFHLEDGAARFSAHTGVTPAYGGTRACGGTHNSLLSLGEEVYLEPIALDPAQPQLAALASQAPPDFRPDLFAFAVRAAYLTHVEGLVARAALSVAGRHRVRRQTPEGTFLEWQSLVVGGHPFGNLMPFFVQGGPELHPAQTAPQGCRLLEFSVGHPQGQALSRLFHKLLINVPSVISQLQLRAVLATPKDKVALSREGIGSAGPREDAPGTNR